LQGLQHVFQTRQSVIPLTSSGTGGLEAAIVNTLPPKSKAICLIAGRFGERFRNICKAFEVETINIVVPDGQAVSPDQLAKALKQIDKNAALRAFYFDLKKYRAKLETGDTPFTMAHTLIRALAVSLKRIQQEGIENIWTRQARNSAAARAGFQALGLELFASRPAHGLTVVKVPAGIDGQELLTKLEKQ